MSFNDVTAAPFMVFFLFQRYRILRGEVSRYLKKHHKRCNCDVIKGRSFVVVPLSRGCSHITQCNKLSNLVKPNQIVALSAVFDVNDDGHRGSRVR